MTQVMLDPDGTQELGLLVIVAAPTGVTYSQQCAGFATECRSAEGFLIPIGAPADAKRLYDWFWDAFQGHCYAMPPRGSPWTPETTTGLAGLVAALPCWHTADDGQDTRHFLKLDLERMDECAEAWIPVITPYGRGILTLGNSD
jgi:hypothetical protein